MEGNVVNEVRLLETAEDIQVLRDQVLSRYAQFRSEARLKREKLEDSLKFQYFKRDADELESWIREKLQVVSDESSEDPTSLQAKIKILKAMEVNVTARSSTIVILDKTGTKMIDQQHFASDIIRPKLDELNRLWKLLLSNLADKSMHLQHTLVLVQFKSQCDEVMNWIIEKETQVTSEEFGDLEHEEDFYLKCEEFSKDIAAQEYRVTEINTLAEKLMADGHPEMEIIIKHKEDLNEAWQNLHQLVI